MCSIYKAVVWSLLLGCGICTANSTSQQEFQQSYSLSAGGTVLIENVYGDVKITAWDRDEVRIEAVKSASDVRRLQDAQIVVASAAGMLSIRTQYSQADPAEPASVEYRVTVPRTANLEQVKLTNGALSIQGVAGSVKASSVNGNIKAEKLEGRAELSTINGQVEADFNRISPSKPISLSSVNGPIVLSIPPGSGAQLMARNLSGGIQSDFGRPASEKSGHRLETVVKGGGTPIHLQNVNGGISIHATWSRERQRPGL